MKSITRLSAFIAASIMPSRHGRLHGSGRSGAVGFRGDRLLRHRFRIASRSLSRLGRPGRAGRDYVIVCRDAGAGGYEAFPDVCRLKDGRLMAVFYAGYDHVSLPTAAWPKGGRIVSCFSSDEGRTWSKAAVLYDGPDDDRDPSIVQLPSGRLLCNFFSLRAKADDPKAWDGLGTWLVESDDCGPHLVEAAPAFGRLLLQLAHPHPARRPPDAGPLQAGEGQGLGRRDRIRRRRQDLGTRRRHSQRRLQARRRDRRDRRSRTATILAVQREPSTTMCASTSADGGKTWSVSKPLGFPGHCPYLLRAPGDILLLAHRLPQTSLHYSLDEGKTWSASVLVDDCLGAYPSMVPLKDGSILIVYYEEGVGSNIRARRFRAGEGGIDWLSPSDGKPVAGASIAGIGVQAWRRGLAARVSRKGDIWTIAGAKRSVELDAASLAIKVRSAGTEWATLPSFDGDLTVRHGLDDAKLRLSAAGRRDAGPYDTGFQTGVSISLAGFKAGDAALDASVRLYVGLDGMDEDLVCRVVAPDGANCVRELLWPASFEPASLDAAVVPFMQGMLLPRDWPRKVWLYDAMSYGRGLYMPWWGFQRGSAAVAAILETPDDAGCRFEHPVGGPTRIDVRWAHSLGRFAYPRSVRFAFFDRGGYVELAKRYRRHVIAKGAFVSLKEKIARNPLAARLLGAPVIHTSILYHIQPQSSYYDRKDPAKNHQLVPFDARAAELRALAAKGVGRAYVHLDGWGARGYDNLHPDILPPNPEAGGWDGMRRLAWACDSLGFIFAVHDQYRDFYLDAASYSPRNAQMEEGGQLSTHGTWYGGMQTYLCPSLAPGPCPQELRRPSRPRHQGQAGRISTSSRWCLPTNATTPSIRSPGRSACVTAAKPSTPSGRAAVSSAPRSRRTGPCRTSTSSITGRSPSTPIPGSGPAMGIPIPALRPGLPRRHPAAVVAGQGGLGHPGDGPRLPARPRPRRAALSRARPVGGGARARPDDVRLERPCRPPRDDPARVPGRSSSGNSASLTQTGRR